MKHKGNIAVLGDGAWGTALAAVLHQNGYQVKVWGRLPHEIDEINRTHENKRFLPGITLSEQILFTNDMQFACQDADMVVLGTPSQYLRGVLEQFKPFFRREKQIIVNISKGIELNTLLRMSELCKQILDPRYYCVLSGPSHAEEVIRKVPT